MFGEAEVPGLFDDLLAPGQRRDSTQAELDVAALVEKACAAIESGKPGQARPAPPCSDCSKELDRAHANGDPLPQVLDAESHVSQGRRIYAGTCAYHTDLEWARLWQLRYDAAGEEKDEPEKRRLIEIANARARTGRKVPLSAVRAESAKAEAAPTAHADGCNCKDCRPKASP